MKIGAHIPTQGDYEKMATYAKEVGCECIQVFSKSPRQWKPTAMDPTKREEMESARQVYDFGPILTHTAYLINITTSKEDLYEKSVEALADELVRGSIIEAEGVNTHLGNVVDGDQTAAVKRAARAIERAFDIADRACEKLGIVCSTRLILENTAGAGTTYGSTVTELFDVINETKVADERLGICIDTCHAWAAGYDVSSAEGWTEIIDEIVNVGALGLWRFAHANDCKFDRGSKKDRHAWIGEGEIGFKGFKILLHLGEKHSELESMPVITELPGEMPEKDIINIEALKALRQG